MATNPGSPINQEAQILTLLEQEQVDSINEFAEVLARIMKIAAEGGRSFKSFTAEQELVTKLLNEEVTAQEQRLGDIERAIQKSIELGESYDSQLKTLKQWEVVQKRIIKDATKWGAMDKEHQQRMLQALKTAKQLQVEYNKIQLDKLHEFLAAVGGPGMASFVRQVSTAAGAIAILTGQVHQYLKDQRDWINQNYALYGSLDDVENSIRAAAQSGGILRDEARKAGRAIMDAGIDAKKGSAELEEWVAAIGDVSVETGISVDAAARYGKSLQRLGLSVGQVKDQFTFLKRAAQTWGVTGRDADIVFGYLNKNAYMLRKQLGSEAEFIKYQQNMMKIAGASKKAGADLATVTDIMDELNTNRERFVLLFGGTDWINEKDNTKLFQAMSKNAGAALKQLEDVPPIIREQMAREMYGMSRETLQQLDEMSKAGAGILDKMVPEALKDTARRATSALYNFQVAIENIGQALNTLMTPFKWIIQGLGFIAALFNSLPNIVKNVIGVFLFFTVVMIAMSKGLGGLFSPFRKLIDWFKGFRKVGEEVGKVARTSIRKDLREIGRGIVTFIKEFAQVSGKGILGLIGAGIALAIASPGLVGFSVAMRIIGMVKRKELDSVGQGIVAFINAFSKVSFKGIFFLLLTGVALMVAAPPLIFFSLAMRILKGMKRQELESTAQGIVAFVNEFSKVGTGAFYLIFTGIALKIASIPLLIFAAAVRLLKGLKKNELEQIAQGIVSFVNAFSAVSVGTIIKLPFIAISVGVFALGLLPFAAAMRGLQGADTKSYQAIAQAIVGFIQEFSKVKFTTLLKLPIIAISLAIAALPLAIFIGIMAVAAKLNTAKFGQVGRHIAAFINSFEKIGVVTIVKLYALSYILYKAALPLGAFVLGMAIVSRIDTSRIVKVGTNLAAFINSFETVRLTTAGKLVVLSGALAIGAIPLAIFVGVMAIASRADTSKIAKVGTDLVAFINAFEAVKIATAAKLVVLSGALAVSAVPMSIFVVVMAIASRAGTNKFERVGKDIAAFINAFDAVKTRSLLVVMIAAPILAVSAAPLLVFGLAIAVLSKVTGWQAVGQGIANFFNAFERIQWGSMLKAAVALVIVAGALYIFGLAASTIEAGKMMAAAVSLVIIAVAMSIMGQMGQSQFVGILLAAVGLMAISAALYVMGLAMQMAPPSAFILMAVALLIFAVALGVAGAIAQALAVPMLIFAGIMLLVGVAMIIVAYAFKIFAGALEQMANIKLAALGAEILAFAVQISLAGPLMTIGVLTLTIASMLLTVALSFLYAAVTIGAAMAVLAKLTGMALKTIATSVRTFVPVIPAILKLPVAGIALAAGMVALGAGMLVAAGMLPLAVLALVAFTMITAALLVLSAGLKPDFIAALPVISANFATGMLSMAQGMATLVGAPYIQFLVAAVMVAVGMAILLGCLSYYASGIAQLPTISQSFGSAMSGLSAGMDALVGSHYIKFIIAAKSAASGLNSLLWVLWDKAAGIATLPTLAQYFYKAMEQIACSMDYMAIIGKGAGTMVKAGSALFAGLTGFAGAAALAALIAPMAGSIGQMFQSIGDGVNVFLQNADQMMQMPEIGWALFSGILPVGYAMAVGAAMLPLAALAYGAFVLVGSAIGMLSSVLTQQFSTSLRAVAEVFSGAMESLSNGMRTLVGSPYIRFGIAASGTAYGLAVLLGALTANINAVQALPKFADSLAGALGSIANATALAKRADPKAFGTLAESMKGGLQSIFGAISTNSGTIDQMPKLTEALRELGDIGTNITGGQNLIDMANAVNTTLQTLGHSLADYAAYVEESTGRITTAIGSITEKLSQVEGTNLNQTVRNYSTIQVRPTLDSSTSADQKHRQTIDKLDGILMALVKLLTVVEKSGGGSGEDVQEIRKLLNQYLPMMAEGADTGLASMVNRWNAGVG